MLEPRPAWVLIFSFSREPWVSEGVRAHSAWVALTSSLPDGVGIINAVALTWNFLSLVGGSGNYNVEMQLVTYDFFLPEFIFSKPLPGKASKWKVRYRGWWCSGSRSHLRESGPWMAVKCDICWRKGENDTGRGIFKCVMPRNGDDFMQSKMYHTWTV